MSFSHLKIGRPCWPSGTRRDGWRPSSACTTACPHTWASSYRSLLISMSACLSPLSLSHSPLSFLTHTPCSPTATPHSHGCRWLALAAAPPLSNYPSRALNLLRHRMLKPWRLLPELDGPQTPVVDTTAPWFMPTCVNRAPSSTV